MSKIARNLVFLLVSQIATWSITLVVLVIAPDALGPDGFGKFGFATSFIQFFTLAASLGTATLLIKSVARDSSVLGSYVYNALVMKVFVVGGLSVLALLIARLIGTTGDKLVLVAFGCVGMLFIVLNEVFVGAQAGLEVMGKPAMWNVVQIYVASGIGLLVLALDGGVVPFGIAFALAPVVPLIANGRKVWPWLRESRRIDFGVWKALVWGGVPLMILTGLNLVYGTIDIPILADIAGDTTVGWYILAYRFVAIPIFIAAATVTAFFPSFSALGAPGDSGVSAEFTQQVNRALRLVVAVSVPAAAGIVVVAEDLLGFFYDSRYDEAAPVMQVLALHIPLAAIGIILGMALIASERLNKFIFVSAGAAVVAPFVAIPAIHWGVDRFDNGAIGAAWSTVGIEVFVAVGALSLRPKGVMDRKSATMCLRILIAGLVMAGAVWALDDLLLVLRILVGVVVYGVASLLVGSLGRDDVRAGRELVGRAVGSIRNRRAPDPVE